MNIKAVAARLAAALLLCVFLFYIGYQMISNLGDSMVTIDAMVVTVEDKLSLEGVFVRSQSLIWGESGASAEYLVEDGDKVAKGQNLAVFLSGAQAVGAYQQLRAIDAELEAQKAVPGGTTGSGDAKKLDGQIYAEMLRRSQLLDGGNAQDAARDYPLLRQMVLARGGGGGADNTAAIEALEARREALRSSLSGSASRLVADRSGYFFRYPDGYETVLTLQWLAEVTPEAIRAITPDSAAFGADVAGTLVDSYEWYFVAVCDKMAADTVKERGSLAVYFPQIDTQSIILTLEQAVTYGSETVLVLKSGLMDSRYLSARGQPADLVVARYTGIKVPREALRQEDGQWGVYCLDGAQQRFKPVKWIYQTDSYVLVEQAGNADKGLYMYDKIITRGKDLSDNKVVR